MPHRTPPDYQGEPAAEAFVRVLEAERQAEQALAACGVRAATCFAEAQAGQHALVERTDERIDAWKTRINAAAARRVAELERQQAAIGAAPDQLDEALRQRIRGAVARLADELVGEG